jgi:hypothetical protein
MAIRNGIGAYNRSLVLEWWESDDEVLHLRRRGGRHGGACRDSSGLGTDAAGGKYAYGDGRDTTRCAGDAKSHAPSRRR